jgi:hypothetical protein
MAVEKTGAVFTITAEVAELLASVRPTKNRFAESEANLGRGAVIFPISESLPQYSTIECGPAVQTIRSGSC